jgi:osmotically-inducible protein OsmY
MLRSALRLVLVIIVVVAALAFFLGYRLSTPHIVADRTPASETSRPVATTGEDQNRVDQVRETGAKVGEKVAAGAERAGEALDDARLTAKIKSKMALGDTLKGSDVSVSTTGHVVTLNGSVANEQQHRRVVDLARETEGVARLDDHISSAGTPR